MDLDEASLIGMLFFVFLLAKGLGWICERLGVAEFVGQVIAGAIIANFAIGSFSLAQYLGINFLAGATTLNANALTVFFEIGLIFLVFTVGLRIRPESIRNVAHSALAIALVGVTVPFALGTALILVAYGDANLYATLFVGTALAASSVGIVSHLLSSHGLVDRREGHLLLAAALFEDLIALVLLAIILALAGHGTQASGDFVIQVVVVVGFAALFVISFLFLSEPIAERLVPALPPGIVRSDRAKAGMLAAAIVLCLGVGYIAETFQLAAILGALFAGMALAKVGESFDLRRSFDALNVFVVPFFFVYIGLYISVGGLLSIGLFAFLVTVLAIAGKLLAGVAEVRTLGRRGALTIGTGLMARGEVAIIIAITAQATGLLSDTYLSAIVMMAIVTTILGPVLFSLVRGPDREPAPDQRPDIGIG